MEIEIEINGRARTLSIAGEETLLDVLWDQFDFGGSEPACEDSTCGRCTVLLDGLPCFACNQLAGACRNRCLELPEDPLPASRALVPPFTFLHHSDLSILLQALGEGGARFRPLAGGSDLVPLMKSGVVMPEAVLDISRAEPLRTIRIIPDSGILIGSLVTLAELADDPRLKGPFEAVAEAAASAGPPQIRNVGTLGGNLLQRPRCPYFRGTDLCWLKGGEDCPAREGDNRISGVFEDGICVAAHASDLATALFAFDAAVHTQSAWNERGWPVEMFLRPPMVEYRDETALEASELITHVQLPEPPPGLRSVYVKASEPGSTFALAAAALAGVVEGTTLHNVRLALGGVASVPRRARAAERILMSGELGGARIAKAVTASLEGARPLSQNAYKLPLLAAAIRSAIERLMAT